MQKNEQRNKQSGLFYMAVGGMSEIISIMTKLSEFDILTHIFFVCGFILLIFGSTYHISSEIKKTG